MSDITTDRNTIEPVTIRRWLLGGAIASFYLCFVDLWRNPSSPIPLWAKESLLIALFSGFLAILAPVIVYAVAKTFKFRELQYFFHKHWVIICVLMFVPVRRIAENCLGSVEHGNIGDNVSALFGALFILLLSYSGKSSKSTIEQK